ncbi:hypothetical protein RND81_01G123000 [Saponaria officinalis]|uniref:histone acetyltransferase n=1 Tax=Saponaria officinalis TaxID=3572 RepID=A0AAW1NDU8_SAPOF
MGQKQHLSTDSTTESKKKRRVNFSPTDSGVEANDCIQIYLVSSKEEAEAGTGHQIDPVDLNIFFGDDGKIYGYQGLKIVIWVSSLSFHAYTDITYESTADRGKGITDLKAVLQDMFAENIVEKKDDFFQTFSTEKQCISSAVSKGEILRQNTSNGNSDLNIEVIRLVMGDMSAGLLYSRLVPLVLLLVDGSNAIDVTDSNWEMYAIVQRTTDPQGDNPTKFLGFAAAYRFFHYPDSLRLRLSQILVLPPYQQKGYGRHLLELLNQVAISENVYDLTVEEPVESLQRIRYYIDVPRLLSHSSVKPAVDAVVSRLKEANLSKRTQTSQFLPPPAVVDDVRKSLKINKKQFTQCWEILVYLALSPVDKHMDNYRIFITDRVKATVIGKDSVTKEKRVIDIPNVLGEEAFVMYKSADTEDGTVTVDEDQANLQEQLQKLVDERIKEIEGIAQKILTKNHA